MTELTQEKLNHWNSLAETVFHLKYGNENEKRSEIIKKEREKYDEFMLVIGNHLGSPDKTNEELISEIITRNTVQLLSEILLFAYIQNRNTDSEAKTEKEGNE